MKHGRYTPDAIAQRKLVRATLRSARLALRAARAELEFDRTKLLRDTPAQEST